MPNVMERARSQGYMLDPKDPTAFREYWVSGTDDPVIAKDEIAAESPDYWLGLVKKSIEVEPQGGDLWYGKVNYAKQDYGELDGQDGSEDPDPPAEADDTTQLGGEFSFTTTGGTQHIVTSLETISTHGRKVGGVEVNVPNNQQGIGVTKESVEGCDIAVPKFEFSLTKKTDFITMKYMKILRDVTGKINKIKWQSFEPGEVLFLGAEGRYNADDGSWLITYKFAAQRTRTDFDVAPDLRVTKKRGWDYLWVGFVDEVNNDAILKRPKYAYVERVYEEEDFRKKLGF